MVLGGDWNELDHNLCRTSLINFDNIAQFFVGGLANYYIDDMKQVILIVAMLLAKWLFSMVLVRKEGFPKALTQANYRKKQGCVCRLGIQAQKNPYFNICLLITGV